MAPPIPRPLLLARPPTEAPDVAAEALLQLLVATHELALMGQAGPEQLHELRFEAYRQAATSWEDHWRIARVADVEEISAEIAAQRGDLEGAWRDWRAAWWIRRLLDAPGEPSRLRAHSDLVMEQLKIATGRGT